MKKTVLLPVMFFVTAGLLNAAKVNEERTVMVDGVQRQYILYVPDNVIPENAPLVFSLHGASGQDNNRSPFRTSVADSEGCIVVYPQGEKQKFWFGELTGWESTGEMSGDNTFFKNIIADVAANYSIDHNRIYCCGFSNGGMMTYSNASTASDIFAAFASISGFQMNEYHQRHTGYRPVPFMHIHGKADDFVKYSLMPVIVDNTTARNGCNPVAEVTEVPGKYTKSVYSAEEGGFPYVYYEIDGMGHNDYTDKTEEGNSAMTMWKFMSQYSLTDNCDKTLKWRLNIDAEGFNPAEHHWKVTEGNTRFSYGTPKKANNADSNVYSSLQFEKGDYKLCFSTTGTPGNKIYIQVETLGGDSELFSIAGEVGKDVVVPFTVDNYGEYQITIAKTSADDRFTSLAIFSCDAPVEAENCSPEPMPEAQPEPETGYLIEIPQDQGKQYDDFARTAMTQEDGCCVYTATGDLQIAFKMMNIDVADCDYVVVKFAEPVAAGWNVAFWDNINTVPVSAGATEYRFELEPSMVAAKTLPQFCMMTLFGGYQSPLVAKVAGVYKHCTLENPEGGVGEIPSEVSQPIAYFSLTGANLSNPVLGINIVRYSDGSSRKLIYK